MFGPEVDFSPAITVPPPFALGDFKVAVLEGMACNVMKPLAVRKYARQPNPGVIGEPGVSGSKKSDFGQVPGFRTLKTGPTAPHPSSRPLFRRHPRLKDPGPPHTPDRRSASLCPGRPTNSYLLFVVAVLKHTLKGGDQAGRQPSLALGRGVEAVRL